MVCTGFSPLGPVLAEADQSVGNSPARGAPMHRRQYRSIACRSLVIVLLLGLMTFSVSGAAAAFKNIKIGDQALPVQLQDLDGQEHSLAQYKDAKAVLLIFWATLISQSSWATPCLRRLTLPLMAQMTI